MATFTFSFYSGAIVVQLPQPYYIGSIRLLLWDCDDRSYSYYIDVSTDHLQWHRVVDMRNEKCQSWQTITFPPRPVCYIKIVGTHNTANEVFHCVHFECPAPTSELSSATMKTTTTTAVASSSAFTATSSSTVVTAANGAYAGSMLMAPQNGGSQVPFLQEAAGQGESRMCAVNVNNLLSSTRLYN